MTDAVEYPRMRPQCRRVALDLIEAGEAGVHSFTFRNSEHGYMADPPKRVSDLIHIFDCDIHVTDKERLIGGHYGVRYIWRGCPPEVMEIIQGRTSGSPAVGRKAGDPAPESPTTGEPGIPPEEGSLHAVPDDDASSGDHSPSSGSLFDDSVGKEPPRNPLSDQEAA